MSKSGRKLAFVLAASDHGAMIVSRLDYRMTSPHGGIGVGYQILETGAFDAGEVSMAVSVLELRRQYFSDGVLAIDCGANIGVHTIEWAKRMTGWGQVLAIEAQERIYYALAGNIALNNCFNAVALNVALAEKPGIINVPQPNYLMPGSFGSLELRKSANNEFIGQPIDYSERRLQPLQAVNIDAMGLARVDFIKLDIEGMELEALAGGAQTIARHRPAMLIEQAKAGAGALRAWLSSRGYAIFEMGLNFLAVHRADPILASIPGTPTMPDAA
jgi:FkbM family methyltransferase